jgi:hypothetical protein
VPGSVSTITRVIASCPCLVVLVARLVPALGGVVTQVTDVIPLIGGHVWAVRNRTPALNNIDIGHTSRIRTRGSLHQGF